MQTADVHASNVENFVSLHNDIFIAVILEGRNLANYVDELERTKEHFCRLGIMIFSDSSLNEKVEVI